MNNYNYNQNQNYNQGMNNQNYNQNQGMNNYNQNQGKQYSLPNIVAERASTISMAFNPKILTQFGLTLTFDVYFTIPNIGYKRVNMKMSANKFKHIELFNFLHKMIGENRFNTPIFGIRSVIIQQKNYTDKNTGQMKTSFYSTLRFKNQIIPLAENISWRDRDVQVGPLLRNTKTYAIEFNNDKDIYKNLDGSPVQGQPQPQQYQPHNQPQPYQQYNQGQPQQYQPHNQPQPYQQYNQGQPQQYQPHNQPQPYQQPQVQQQPQQDPQIEQLKKLNNDMKLNETMKTEVQVPEEIQKVKVIK